MRLSRAPSSRLVTVWRCWIVPVIPALQSAASSDRQLAKLSRSLDSMLSKPEPTDWALSSQGGWFALFSWLLIRMLQHFRNLVQACSSTDLLYRRLSIVASVSSSSNFPKSTSRSSKCCVKASMDCPFSHSASTKLVNCSTHSFRNRNDAVCIGADTVSRACSLALACCNWLRSCCFSLSFSSTSLRSWASRFSAAFVTLSM
mmetsp:Transcript_125931/g.218247  ORF Transcript_125931/g.218247 Transcript_125931/m.218247 type:complete len:202 (-) Transcript_125931:2698-3303(-)